MKHKLESRLPGKKVNNLSYADNTTLMTESRGTKEPVDESERGAWKIWLKTQYSINKDQGIQSHHFMANI